MKNTGGVFHFRYGLEYYSGLRSAHCHKKYLQVFIGERSLIDSSTVIHTNHLPDQDAIRMTDHRIESNLHSRKVNQ